MSNKFLQFSPSLLKAAATMARAAEQDNSFCSGKMGDGSNTLECDCQCLGIASDVSVDPTPDMLILGEV